MFLRRNRDETIRDDPIHTSNLVHSRVIDMAPSATEEGEAEIMSDAKKKEKKVWSKPPKIDTSAITGIRAITAIQIASGHWLLILWLQKSSANRFSRRSRSEYLLHDYWIRFIRGISA